MKGVFITFEGVEGCGKTTQIERLRHWLAERGHPVDVTREPGGTAISEAIRELLLDPANSAMGPNAELLLYEAARAQHVHERIRPALQRGHIVLCDRFADSTTAYQGAGRGIDPAWLDQLHRIATGGIWPDITFLLDLDPVVGLERVRSRGRYDRLEQETIDFHRRVREGFRSVAAREPGRVIILDGAAPAEDIASAIQAHLQRRLAHQPEEEHELF